MLINPKIPMQQNNIYENKKIKVTLPYSDEFIFYKLLDQHLEAGKTVIITFPNEKLTEGSGLHKRLGSCANGSEFFEKMLKLIMKAKDFKKHVVTRDFVEIWKATEEVTQQAIYQAYNVEYAYDNEKGSYFVLLEPNGEGNTNKAWMFMA